MSCLCVYLALDVLFGCFFFFFKQKTAYEMRISDWSSDVRSSDLSVFDQGDIDGAAKIYAVEAAGGDLGLVLEVISRVACDDTDRAAHRIAPEERSLRPFQHPDALQVEKIRVGANVPRKIYAVNIYADARFEIEREIILTDAADI